MPHVTDLDRGLPPGRYGSPRRTPRWVLVLLGIVGVAAVVPVLLTAVHHATPSTRGTLTSYVVVDDHSVRASVDITKPDGSPATCTLQARNFYSDIVGSVELTLPPTAPSGVVTKTFPTSDKAVVVEVTDCVARAGD